MQHTIRATSKNPRLIVFLVDESRSMQQIYAGQQKATWVADEINKQLRELVKVCVRTGRGGSQVVKPYIRVAALGYGGIDRDDPEVHSLLIEHSTQYEMSIADLVETTPRLDSQGRRQFVELNPIGWTPTAAGMRRAGTIIKHWLEEKSDEDGSSIGDMYCPSPTIIHITDGVPTDDEHDNGPVERWVEGLAGFGTQDGPPVIINVGVPDSEEPLPSCLFPTSEELPDIPAMRRLWELSSPMSPSHAAKAATAGFIPARSAGGRRMYVQAGRDTDLSRVMEIGSFDADAEPH